ncbi:hypothetical protein Salmuc_01727 [Salipiger mucosus DSM 16094]|uniref:Uncharacterized protein n=1 Tax=Salipiger mucosus DSM 16094 TaxID=1123237 RepID=S9QWI6_9RHOB|nr:hypothetical protein Salmuc_01727 [Salipiger mucosus DSM 16094]
MHHEDPRLNGTTYIACDSHGRIYDKATQAFGTYGEVPVSCLFSAEEARELEAQDEDFRSLRETGGVSVHAFSSLVGEVELQARDENGDAYVTTLISEAVTADLRVQVRYHETDNEYDEVEVNEEFEVDHVTMVLRETAEYFPGMEPAFREPEPERAIVPGFG